MTYRSRRATRGTDLFTLPALLTLVLAFGVVLTGCDSGADDASEGAATETTPLAGAVATLATEAGASSGALVAAARSFEDRYREPGTLWYVAAEVQSSLTSEQVARLEAKLDEQRAARDARRAERADRPRGPRGHGLHGRGLDGTPLLDRALTDDLALTDEQTAAVEAIREAYRDDFEASRESGLADDERRAQAKELAEAMRAEIDAVLTEAQRTALEAHRAERQTEREERRAAEQAAMADALALTDAQQADLDALRAEMEAQRGTSDRSETRATFRAALEAMLDDTQAEIVTVHAALRLHLRGEQGGRRGPRGRRG